MCDCCMEMKAGLQYSTPALGGWGTMRTCMLVPECHVLYAIPFACGRHGSIAAYMHGIKDRLSCLFLKEEELVSGGYEERLVQAVDEILIVLQKRPKAFVIVVSCIDDLLGTDHDAILQILRENHPDIRFAFGHMNPISKGGKTPPALNMQRTMYGLLEKDGSEIKNMVNLIGNQVRPEAECELFSLLRKMGVEQVAHISDYSDFDEWQEMAHGRLNLLLSKAGKLAAEDMKKRFGIPAIEMRATYNPDLIMERYQQIADILGTDLPKEVDEYYNRAVEKIKLASEYFQGVKIVVSNACTASPFDLAGMLKKFGFQVVEVMAEEVESDQRNQTWFRETYPDVRISLSTHHSGVLREPETEQIIALGMQAGYITGSRHVVTLSKDEGLFGFHGIERMMDMMIDAWQNEVDLKQKIRESGLVV